jgi:enolase
MIAFDGTPNKAHMDANALLAVSVAFARAMAVERAVPLYQHLADILGQPLRTLPRLNINLFTGGKHAGMQVPIQHVILVPMSARTIDDGLAMTFEVYQTAAKLIHRKYKMRALTADEGGLAPMFPDATTMLVDTVESIRRAGLSPGNDVAIAVDVAASHFYQAGRYHLGNQALDSTAMIDQIVSWLDLYLRRHRPLEHHACGSENQVFNRIEHIRAR